MSKQTTQVNFRMPVSLKKKIENAVAQKVAQNGEGSITEELVRRLELSFDLSKADGYNQGYSDATAHMTFAMTAALQNFNLPLDQIQSIINDTMKNFDKNA